MTPHGLGDAPVRLLGHGTGWLVADKPHGMSVHNAPGDDLCSVLNRFLARTPAAGMAVAYDAAFGMHPVHRLDKETSGAMLLACRRDVLDECARQFAQHLVTKRYLALVHGMVRPPDDWGLWQWPLSPRAAGRRNPRGSGRRRTSRTHYRLKRLSPHYSLLECRLVTGRTHQIRRHAALAGHPLVGDHRYGSKRACRYLEKNFGFIRLGLHASALAMEMPGSSRAQTFRSERLPSEMERLLAQDTANGVSSGEHGR